MPNPSMVCRVLHRGRFIAKSLGPREGSHELESRFPLEEMEDYEEHGREHVTCRHTWPVNLEQQRLEYHGS